MLNVCLVFKMIEYNIEAAILFQPASFRFIYNGKEIQLSHKETKVLQLLCAYQQQVVERKVFLQEIWGDREGAGISLNKSILSLRRKFDSLGYLGAIKTVTRVGYMLCLNTLKIDATTEEKEIVKKPDDNISTISFREKNTGSRVKLSITYLVLIVIGLLFVYSFHMDQEVTPLAYKIAYKTPSLTIIKMANLKRSVNYPELINHLPKNHDMQVSLSNSAISFIGDKNGQKSWSKVFVLDHDININKQLTCIADYINDSSNIFENHVAPLYTPTIPEQGPVLHRKRFYSSCKDNKPDYIGEMVINSTHYPSDHPKFKMPSSLIQDVLFYDNKTKPVFHFTKVFRVNHIQVGKDETDFFVSLHNKSIKIKSIDQGEINSNKYLNLIFNEYEEDDIFVRSLMSSKDGKSITVLSSVFDGTLSQGIRLDVTGMVTSSPETLS